MQWDCWTTKSYWLPAVLQASGGRALSCLPGRREGGPHGPPGPEGEEVVAGIRKAGGTAVFIQADLTRIETIPDIINRTVANFGRLDGAFNNAGVTGGGPIETLDEKSWDQIIDTNLKASFFALQAQVAQLKKQGGGGSIVFNSSVLASFGSPGTSIYSASKGGIDALTRAAAVELGPFNIRVNSVNPSITRTPMTTGRITENADGTESHPGGRHSAPAARGA